MSAIISSCCRYRYRLEREVAAAGIVVAFFGVNPSRADASVRDHTDLKWTGFAHRWGARKYIAGNPFAWRSTNVRELANVADPIGPENDAHLTQIIADADLLVPCWGDRGKLPKGMRRRLDAVADMLRASNKPLKVFGLTSGGDPKHPLMLAYDTPLIDWSRP
ncbi:DUF1643 domain-containing protein [Burkholderia dolosa]|uniref:DUF1643 domain-containing protein n=1 Tax=Burkholderia dolosa TaxID=152500 RepID=A0A892I498_9BURK|nr:MULTISPECIES: DUF1643 domain-containing protein [Burkholderia]AKE03815.1 hypothetical protein XM57_13180 [Burkholderia cepacia]AJY14523.1 hypothetical protein AK34_1593 [Burkholderia dolosa AU0158]AYZ98580.1 DUF1643 domain-containing protein [Burkholderia dolosa]EAY68965.1 hypothetical protein BDAG_01703 [Burkholderia dolosa AU0158]MBR8418982.1 DUF1643 domain-containing protein [Burkholderia dolosa]